MCKGFQKQVADFLTSYYNHLGVDVNVFRYGEFQNRGSPHINMLVLTSDAPKYKEN